MHYLDNSATTSVKKEVVDEISNIMTNHFANPSSLYDIGAYSEQVLNKSRMEIAKALGASETEIIFTSCGTESNNIAIQGAVNVRKAWADNIICLNYEHPSVYNVYKKLESDGWCVHYVKPLDDGNPDIDTVISLVNDKTALVSAMHVNNETGAITDIAKLSKAVKAKNRRTAMHVDGVQAFMKLPVNLSFTDIDTYTVSGHKIHAPKGVGALYIKKGFNISAPFKGGLQEKSIRPGTENVPYIAGFAKAVSMMKPNLAKNGANAKKLNALLRSEVSTIDDVIINSPENALPYVLNISVLGIRSETFLHYLEREKIYVSSGSACSKGEASHTLKAMGKSHEIIDSALRISFSDETNEEDIKALVKTLRQGVSEIARAKRKAD